MDIAVVCGPLLPSVTQGNTAGLFRGALLVQVVTVMSQSISWGAFCNKDDQRKVPKPVCRTNVPTAPSHASLGQEDIEMVLGTGPPRSSPVTRKLENTDCAFRRDQSEWRCNWPYPVIDDCSTFVTHWWQDAQRLVTQYEVDCAVY